MISRIKIFESSIRPAVIFCYRCERSIVLFKAGSNDKHLHFADQAAWTVISMYAVSTYSTWKYESQRPGIVLQKQISENKTKELMVKSNLVSGAIHCSPH